jgi:tetratricopeptide (TPR) repeat protein
MRRVATALVILLALAATAAAQMGKQVSVRAGTAEDRLLAAIQASRDPGERLELLNEFLAETEGTDASLLAYELLLNHWWAEKDYAKAYDAGEKALGVDPDNFATAVNLFRIATEQQNAERMDRYGRIVGEIVQRYKARPMPEGMDETMWRHTQQQTLEEAASSINYVELTLFNSAYQQSEPAARAAALERFLEAFPESTYAMNAQMVVAATYQQSQQYDKMLRFANAVLERNPSSYAMLLLLADYWSERGEELDKAEANATRALELLDALERPEHLGEEEWEQEISVRKGLAYSALGQVHIHRRRHAQAVEAFQAASPLLKNEPISYARNLYRLGFTLAQMRRTAEARRILTEAISIESPYKQLAQQTLNQISGRRP